MARSSAALVVVQKVLIVVQEVRKLLAELVHLRVVVEVRWSSACSVRASCSGSWRASGLLVPRLAARPEAMRSVSEYQVRNVELEVPASKEQSWAHGHHAIFGQRCPSASRKGRTPGCTAGGGPWLCSAASS